MNGRGKNESIAFVDLDAARDGENGREPTWTKIMRSALAQPNPLHALDLVIGQCVVVEGSKFTAGCVGDALGRSQLGALIRELVAA